MGTNYYLETNYCPTCGHPRDRIHIGKKSCGWVFCFQSYPDENLDTLNKWLEKLRYGKIVTEYGEQYTLDQFKTIIQQTKTGKHVIDPSYKQVDGYDWLERDFS